MPSSASTCCVVSSLVMAGVSQPSSDWPLYFRMVSRLSAITARCWSSDRS